MSAPPTPPRAPERIPLATYDEGPTGHRLVGAAGGAGGGTGWELAGGGLSEQEGMTDVARGRPRVRRGSTSRALAVELSLPSLSIAGPRRTVAHTPTPCLLAPQK